MGYPYPPPSRTGWGSPVRRQSNIASTCYVAGGMPLAFTQEDFLVAEFNLIRSTLNPPLTVHSLLCKCARKKNSNILLTFHSSSFLPPAPEGWGRYCFYRRMSVHGGGGYLPSNQWGAKGGGGISADGRYQPTYHPPAGQGRYSTGQGRYPPDQGRYTTLARAQPG